MLFILKLENKMNIQSDIHKSNEAKLQPYLAVQGFIRRLIGLFTLTEEERLLAGIYVDHEERDGLTDLEHMLSPHEMDRYTY